MIDIKDLRAGNLVKTNGKPSGTVRGQFYKVASTDSTSSLDELKGSATIETIPPCAWTSVGAWSAYLIPIKITREILEKLGFTEVSEQLQEFNNFNGFHITVSCHDVSIMDKSYHHVLVAEYKYLHQLQNLVYYATHKELNVDVLIKKE